MAVTRQDFEDAIAQYWGVKSTQNDLSKIKDAVGAGTASSVRAGKHFDSVAGLIAKFFLEAGYPKDYIRVEKKQGLELPGYFRPQKQWDVVVSMRNTLVAAFELKGLGGPSFGNNYNNRVEEALGSAVDLRHAALAKLYPGEKPWLGYFFIMEDAKGSQGPVRIAKGAALPPESIWDNTSYQDRFGIFCQRLIDESLYDSVCYVTSSKNSPAPSEPVEQLDWAHFAAGVRSRISYLGELGYPNEG
ncbi:PaeR7I family type II restriction endonuclease [Nocardiopsis lambiniae]|uniref:PaeR7I family type II restriction endonuclease n=1 Tax=Nocardiopsis lambiniae TaxID=3075539 RepID=A0ABU2MFY3_9ACTN|nr:PaeR7I family type II restriction endonuclease [Nocardiopsis sp. DSM 44743]MDT0331482.1 PaeR7I family type II restriction endonuclease [Nocardiopsis sp. DSM 44743]